MTNESLALRDTADVLAFIPYLLGFHPTDSLVLLAVRDGDLAIGARADLPPAGTPAREVAGLVDYLVRMVRRQSPTGVLVVGYGPAERVDHPALALDLALSAEPGLVSDIVRAHDGRYWSYLCQRPECCPPEGTPYDISSSLVAAHAVYSGRVALPDRQALRRLVGPVDPESRAAMRGAVERADRRLADLSYPDGLVKAGTQALDRAVARGEAGGRLTDDEAAWLLVLLAFAQVRDLAWDRLAADPDQLPVHKALLLDLTRRAEPDLVPAPASLLALAAWLGGDGALAAAALDRALAAEPDYGLANLIAAAFERGIPPATIAGWTPPEPSPSPKMASRKPGRRGRRRSSSRRAGNRSK